MTQVRLFKKADDGVVISLPHDNFQGGVHVQQQIVQFSSTLLTGQTITIDMDGYTLTQAFDTDHETTLTTLAAQIAARPNVLSSVFNGVWAITVVANTPGVNISFTNGSVTGSTYATGTVTYGSPADGDTLTVDGTTFTKVASSPGANEFTDDTELTALIDALASVDATLDTGVITITAETIGSSGNSITLAKTGSALSLSGATLSGGYSAPSINTLINDPYELTFADITFPSYLDGLDYVDIAVEDLPASDSTTGDWHERLYFDGTPSLVNLVIDSGWDYALKPFGLVRTEYLNRIRSAYDAELALEVKASGTVTYGAPSNGDTLTVDGSTFTKVAATPSAGEFSTISELTALIQALSNVNATDNGSVITITAAVTGTSGNSIALSKTGSALTLSGSTLTGGSSANAVTLAGYQRNIDAVYEIDELGSTANNYESTRMTSPLDEPKDEWALFWCNRDLDNLNAGADRATYRTRLLAKIADIEAAIAGR